MLSFMDVFSEYNQIRMNHEDEEKTTFVTSKCINCYTMMPFGLKSAGSTYQRLVSLIFKEVIGDFIEVYIDDIIVKLLRTDDHLMN